MNRAQLSSPLLTLSLCNVITRKPSTFSRNTSPGEQELLFLFFFKEAVLTLKKFRFILYYFHWLWWKEVVRPSTQLSTTYSIRQKCPRSAPVSDSPQQVLASFTAWMQGTRRVGNWRFFPIKDLLDKCTSTSALAKPSGFPAQGLMRPRFPIVIHKPVIMNILGLNNSNSGKTKTH